MRRPHGRLVGKLQMCFIFPEQKMSVEMSLCCQLAHFPRPGSRLETAGPKDGLVKKRFCPEAFSAGITVRGCLTRCTQSVIPSSDPGSGQLVWFNNKNTCKYHIWGERGNQRVTYLRMYLIYALFFFFKFTDFERDRA